MIAANYEIFTRIVDAPERQDTFFCTYLNGYHKGRKVTLMCPHFDRGDSVEFYAELRNVPRPQGAFLISYPRPTENTIWKGNKVFYSKRGKFFRQAQSYYKRYAENELIMMLEELFQAAEIVESGAMPS